MHLLTQKNADLRALP